MQTFTIDRRHFIAGESESDAISDKGFSPDSYNLNLTYKRGMLYFAPSATNRGDTTLTGNPIATADDRNYIGNDKYILDDEGAFYTLKGSTFTKRQTSASTFVLGTSDIIQFNLVTYATATDSLHELTGSDLATLANVWAGLDSNFRHPLEVVEDEMFIANKNVIYYLNSAGTTGTAFTLPVQVNVTTLRRHPDGRTLMAFCGTTGDLNGAHSRPGSGRVYYCDPTLRDWTREIVTEEQIDGSRMVGGVVYVTMGDRFGFWNGDGFEQIKKLSVSSVTFSHQISNISDVVVVRDGLNVRAYGDLGAGRVWWNMWRNDLDSNHINCIAYKGGNVLLTGFGSAGSGVLYETDYDSVGGGPFSAAKFYTNRLDFGQEAIVARFVALHDATQSATRFILAARNTEDSETTVVDKTHGLAGVTRTREEISVREELHQFVLNPQNDDLGWRLFRFFYETVK